MKSYYYVIIFVVIAFIGILIFVYKDKNIKYKLSEAQKQIEIQIGEGIIEINDLKLNTKQDIDFSNKKATANINGQNVNYTILDILQPFNIDQEGDHEYPFLFKAEYPDGTITAYLAIARKKDNKFVSVDQVKVGNPDKIDEIHEYNDNEVLVEAFVGEGDNKQRAHLSYKFINDKIIPDPNNIDLDNYKPPTQTPTPSPVPSNTSTQTNDKPVNNSSGKVALTFDDGPGTFTPNVLDALKDKGIKATFFMIGQNAQSHQDLVQRVHNEGHEIGNHTYTHPDLSKLSYDAQMDEIKKTNNAINNIVGVTPHWLRPPYGNFNDDTGKVLSDLGMQKVLWNVDTRDWSGLSADEIYNGAVANLRDGAIILMHDGVANSSETAKAIPRIIDTIRSQGYQMVIISEL